MLPTRALHHCEYGPRHLLRPAYAASSLRTMSRPPVCSRAEAVLRPRLVRSTTVRTNPPDGPVNRAAYRAFACNHARTEEPSRMNLIQPQGGWVSLPAANAAGAVRVAVSS